MAGGKNQETHRPQVNRRESTSPKNGFQRRISSSKPAKNIQNTNNNLFSKKLGRASERKVPNLGKKGARDQSHSHRGEQPKQLATVAYQPANLIYRKEKLVHTPEYYLPE